jgi:hypothetical protein
MTTAPTCGTGLTICSGACVDLQTDPDHCGACGTGCGTWFKQCINGQCAGCPAGFCSFGQNGCGDPRTTVFCGSGATCNDPSVPVCAANQTCAGGQCVPIASYTIASSLAVNDLQVDGTNIYFVDTAGGTVNSMPNMGGTVKVLAGGLAKPTHLALDDQYVYFNEYLGGAVRRVPKAGGSPPAVVAATTEPSELVVDGQNLYWIDGITTTVWFAPKAGGAPTALYTYPPPNLSFTKFLRQNTSSVFTAFYYGMNIHNGVLYQIAKTGGSAPKSLYGWIESGLNPVAPLLALAATDTAVYFAQQSSGSGAVLSRALGGGPVQQIWPSGVAGPLLADTSFLVASGGLPAFNMSTLPAGPLGIITLSYCSNYTPLTELSVNATLLAMDSTYIYWSDGAMIGRVAK